MAAKPVLALVGRPNVGKSTLFNRLVGGRRAIVEDTPGTTRDRHYADAEWGGRVFSVIDTGGLVLEDGDNMSEQIRLQAEIAMQEADAIVFLTDVLDGVSPADYQIAEMLRRTNKPVLLVVNKVDSTKRDMAVLEFYALGMGDPLAISAERGLNTGDLLDAIVAVLPDMPFQEELPDAVHVALVGRTNVGKSSLLNRLMGEERVIVTDIPGTTRDTIDTQLTYDGQPVVLIDTAGIRRRGRIEQGVEKYSVIRSMRAIERADVALLMIDAQQGLSAQDAHIAGFILEAWKSAVVLVNKWDAVEKDNDTMNQFTAKVRKDLNFLDYVPILFISAKTGQRVDQVLPLALRVQEERLARVTTGSLNRILQAAQDLHSPSSRTGQHLRLYYATQVRSDPPTFLIYVNNPKLAHFTYLRFIENQLRAEYPFIGTPIRIVLRAREH